MSESPTNLISSAVAPFQLSTIKTKFPMQVSEVVQVIEGPESPGQGDTDQRKHLYDTAELRRGLQNIRELNTSFIFSRDIVVFLVQQVIPLSQETVEDIENKEMKVALIIFVLTAVWFIRFVKQ